MLEITFKFIEYYLPVFIPIFLTILSVLSGILTGRIEKNFSSILKIHNDVVLGLFSFIIWALVTYQQTGLIKLNNEYSISFIRVIILLFINFIAVIVGLILVKHKWCDKTPALPGSDYSKPDEKEIVHTKIVNKRENLCNGAFLFFTILLVFLPLWLKVKTVEVQSSKEKNGYRVAIPYKDESIAKQIGVYRWSGRMLCEIYDIKANDKKDAIIQALDSFEKSGKNIKIYSNKYGEDKKVSIQQENIVIQGE